MQTANARNDSADLYDLREGIFADLCLLAAALRPAAEEITLVEVTEEEHEAHGIADSQRVGSLGDPG